MKYGWGGGSGGGVSEVWKWGRWIVEVGWVECGSGVRWGGVE